MRSLNDKYLIRMNMKYNNNQWQCKKFMKFIKNQKTHSRFLPIIQHKNTNNLHRLCPLEVPDSSTSNANDIQEKPTTTHDEIDI